VPDVCPEFVEYRRGEPVVGCDFGNTFRVVQAERAQDAVPQFVCGFVGERDAEDPCWVDAVANEMGNVVVFPVPAPAATRSGSAGYSMMRPCSSEGLKVRFN